VTPHAYEVLGLDPTASMDQVRAAYRRLAQIYHPDRYAMARADVREEAERRMMHVNAAYTAITDARASETQAAAGPAPEWRPIWDRVLRNDDHWKEERRRRAREDAERRRIHARWDQIEQMARQRAAAGEPPPRPTDVPGTELPSAKPKPERPAWAQRAAGMKPEAVEAHHAAEELRRTIDLDARRASRRKA
jgi:DnaJ-like protein